MLNRIDIRRFKGDILSDEVQSIYFPGRRGDGHRFHLRDAQGLGPVKANISTAPMASIDGDRFLSASTSGRNIVLTVGLNPQRRSDESVSILRQLLMSVAPPKEHVVIGLHFDDQESLYTNGWIESNDPSIFSPNTDQVISIVAITPYLEKSSISIPWTNIIGTQYVPYNDIQSVGFTLDIEMVGNTSLLTIVETGISKSMQFRDLRAGDKLRIKTQIGSKSVTLTRGSVTGDALTLMVDRTIWYNLSRDASNMFGFTDGQGAISSALFTYTPVTIGV